MLKSCANRTVGMADAPKEFMRRWQRGTNRGAPPTRTYSWWCCGSFGGRGDVLPKERGEVTLVRAPDLETDLAQGHVSRGQQPFRLLHPAGDYVLVVRQPGSVLEQA